MAENPYIYQLKDVVKARSTEGYTFRLRVPTLNIRRGEKIALIGESGCGKSTLLDMLALILQPSEMKAFSFAAAGEKGTDAREVDIMQTWKRRKRNQLATLRKRHMGYVMQTGGLLPYLSVRDNMNLSRKILGMKDDGTLDHLAKELGLTRHMNKLPDALSTGERQRVAIGRALAHRPSIVIADEPTASVDPFAAEKIMALFINMVEEMNITVIVASHAWRHIKQLGLRRLEHHTRRSSDGRMTETLVSG